MNKECHINESRTADRSNFYVLVSEKAGNYPDRIEANIRRIFGNHGLQVTFDAFTDISGISERVGQACKQGYSSFLAVGGDGTISLLADCLSGKPHRLGIVPTGTTNTLARILHIPLEIDQAIEVSAASNCISSIDGLEVENRTFFLMVSCGVSSISLSGVDAERKSAYGILAYLLGIIRKRKHLGVKKYLVTVDEKRYEIETAEVQVTNTGMIATPDYRIYPGSHMDDGEAEVLMLREWNGKEVFGALLDIVNRRKSRNIKLLAKGATIDISCEEPIEVQADGDILGKTPVHIKVIHKAVNFIVPEYH